MIRCCSLHDMMLANTFSTLEGECWTYRNGDQRRQLDYILLPNALRKRMLACSVTDDVCIGSDHRAVVAVFNGGAKTGRKQKQKRCDKGWSVDMKKYQEHLDMMLDRVWHESMQERPSGTRTSDIPDDQWEAALLDGLDAAEPTLAGGASSSTAA